MKLKRLATFVATFAISAIGYSLINTASASAATLGWTGAAGNNQFYTAGNWEPAQAPAAGDILIFPGSVNGTIDTTPPQNSPTFNTIQFLEGSDVTFSSSSQHLVASTVLLDRNTYVSIDQIQIAEIGQSGVGLVGIGEDSTLFVRDRLLQSALEMLVDTHGGQGSGTLILDRYQPSTSDQIITVSNGLSLVFGAGKNGDTSPRTVRIETGSILASESAGILGSSVTEITENSILILPEGFSTGKNMIIGNNASILAEKNSSESGTITLSGGVKVGTNVINEDGKSTVAKYSSGNDKINLLLTGNVSGGKIVPESGSLGSVIINPASGKTNTSVMPNGETKPATKTVTITDQNIDYVEVFGNNIVIINGKRGETTVHPGGILKGKGTVGILDVLSGGRVAPGESPGILNAGNTTFESGAFFEAEIAGTTVGAEYDQLKVTGTVNLGGATLDTKLINDFKPKSGDAFTIIDNDGTDAITGTFKDLPEGTTFTIDGTVFKISYVGGDGNDVVLTVQSVPGAPNTGMKLLSGNPLFTLGLTTISAGALFILARKYGDALGR